MTQKPSSHEKSPPASRRKAVPTVKTADGLSVFCAFTRLMRVKDLQAHPENWNEHPPEQLEMAAKIFEHGIRRPIRISSRSGLITVGHGALQTAMHKGWKEWPVEIQHYTSRAEEIADLTADNQLGKKARTNEEKLASLLQQITGEIDITLAGVTDAEFKDLLASLDASAPPASPQDKPKEAKVVDIDAMYQVIVECKNEAHQKEVLTHLETKGEKCRLLTL